MDWIEFKCENRVNVFDLNFFSCLLSIFVFFCFFSVQSMWWNSSMNDFVFDLLCSYHIRHIWSLGQAMTPLRFHSGHRIKRVFRNPGQKRSVRKIKYWICPKYERKEMKEMKTRETQMERWNWNEQNRFNFYERQNKKTFERN